MFVTQALVKPVIRYRSDEERS